MTRRSFNRDPESTATLDRSTRRPRRWQSTAGSAFAAIDAASDAKRDPRREVAEGASTKGNVRCGNLTLGRG
jgi:hypothetical protein